MSSWVEVGGVLGEIGNFIVTGCHCSISRWCILLNERARHLLCSLLLICLFGRRHTRGSSLQQTMGRVTPCLTSDDYDNNNHESVTNKLRKKGFFHVYCVTLTRFTFSDENFVLYRFLSRFHACTYQI